MSAANPNGNKPCTLEGISNEAKCVIGDMLDSASLLSVALVSQAMGDILLSRLRRRFSSDASLRFEFTINGNQRVSGTPLQWAAYHGCEDLVKMVLKHQHGGGINRPVRNPTGEAILPGMTALSLAAMSSDEGTIHCLLRAGAWCFAHQRDGLHIDPIAQSKNNFVVGWIGENALEQANKKARAARRKKAIKRQAWARA